MPFAEPHASSVMDVVHHLRLARPAVHSPVEISVQGGGIGSAPATHDLVRSAERLWDALALLMIMSGTTLFLMARNGLASIAAGTATLPPGVPSFVQRADYFSAQSTLGLAMIGVGVTVGIVSSLRHTLRRRAAAAPQSGIA